MTHITVHPRDPNTVYVTFGGYHGGDLNPYVLHVARWRAELADVSGNLPQAPVQDLVLVRGWKLVATDVRVFVAGKRRPKKYFAHGRLLPNVPINDIRYVPTNRTLYAGTFGRGIYAIHIPEEEAVARPDRGPTPLRGSD